MGAAERAPALISPRIDAVPLALAFFKVALTYSGGAAGQKGTFGHRVGSICISPFIRCSSGVDSCEMHKLRNRCTSNTVPWLSVWVGMLGLTQCRFNLKLTPSNEEDSVSEQLRQLEHHSKARLHSEQSGCLSLFFDGVFYETHCL